MDYSAFETVTRRLALAAGAAIMEVYGADDLGVEVKSDDSPVTKADLAADQIISDGVRAAFPDMALVTEEQASSHTQDVRSFVIVDPLDGTKEFVRRRGDFTVNIALIEDGVPTRGVVYAPARKRLFYTQANGQTVEESGPHGADPGPLTPLKVATPDNAALRVVATKSHKNPETEAYIARFDVADLVSAGSSLKFCLVAAGEADLYPRLGPTMEWDTAAGDAVLRGAGGRMADLMTLEPFEYGKPAFRNGYFVAYAPGVAL
ncbi:MAG: 3'(2'),5'-bisphosphate nucleotidase CysQ, partial [Pseudomonadota bacterium]